MKAVYTRLPVVALAVLVAAGCTLSGDSLFYAFEHWLNFRSDRNVITSYLDAIADEDYEKIERKYDAFGAHFLDFLYDWTGYNPVHIFGTREFWETTPLYGLKKKSIR